MLALLTAMPRVAVGEATVVRTVFAIASAPVLSARASQANKKSKWHRRRSWESDQKRRFMAGCG
jgi:hypothetical protein